MTDLLEYKCPSCGAPIKYDDGKDQMACDFCEASFSLETLKKYDADLHSACDGKEFDWHEESREELDENLTGMTCSSCGAEIVGDENTAANECPYCGNTNIIKKQLSGIYKPDFIIPFKVKKEEAVAALTEHYKGKRLLPDTFVKGNRVENIQGVYVPFWLVDGKADVDALYQGSRVEKKWSDDKYDYTQRNYYQLLRRGRYDFEKVPVDASSKMDDVLMESIEPFHCQEVREFATAYLSGYLTDKYDVESTQCRERANQRIRNTTERSLQESLGKYSSVDTKRCSIQLEEGHVSYALFPVWLLTTRYENKPYTFAMNGQTGKFIGDLPIDKGKLHKYMAAAFVGSFPFLYFLVKYILMAFL